MKPSKPIKTSVLHNVRATDPINGRWHKGWKFPNSETIAFYYRRQWYASVTGNTFAVPMPTRDTALNLKERAL